MSEFIEALGKLDIKPVFESDQAYRDWCEEFRNNSEDELIRLEKLRQEALQNNIIKQ